MEFEIYMTLELHIGNEVIKGTQIDSLLMKAEGIQEPWVLYACFKSKMNTMEQPKKILPKKKPERRRPVFQYPLLEYDLVIKADYWLTQRYSRTEIARRIHCSMAQLTRSLVWLDRTQGKEEYDTYDTKKKNLLEPK